MHCASRSGHNDVIELLMSRDASVSVRTRSGLSPLHMAAQGDHAHIVRLLLQNGATVDDVTSVIIIIIIIKHLLQLIILAVVS